MYGQKKNNKLLYIVLEYREIQFKVFDSKKFLDKEKLSGLV